MCSSVHLMNKINRKTSCFRTFLAGLLFSTKKLEAFRDAVHNRYKLQKNKTQRNWPQTWFEELWRKAFSHTRFLQAPDSCKAMWRRPAIWWIPCVTVTSTLKWPVHMRLPVSLDLLSVLLEPSCRITARLPPSFHSSLLMSITFPEQFLLTTLYKRVDLCHLLYPILFFSIVLLRIWNYLTY